MSDLKLGILLWQQAATWPEMLDAAKRVDRLGYAHLWTWDHLYAIFGDPYQPIFEGWSLLNAWARETEQTRLGLLVGANTFRNPGLVAKSAATLDHISDGRAILGIGGAWMELEHTAHGIDFGTGFGQRLDWLDESVGAMRRLLDGESVTSEPGGHYAFEDLRHNPPPVQERLPIMIGGSGEKKTLRTVARYADMWNAMGPIDVMTHKIEVLQGHCDAVGRDIAEIEFTLGVKVTIRDTEAEAIRVWKAAMAAQQDAAVGCRERHDVLERDARAARRPAAALHGARLPDDHLRAAGAVRRRDARALHRRGQAAHLTAAGPAVRQPATDLEDRARLGGGREARGVADRGVVEGVGDELVDRRVVGEAEVAQGRALVDVAEELVDGADGGAGGGRLGLGGRGDAERDPDEGQLAIARAEVEAEDLRQDGGERRPVGDLAARPDRVAQRVDEPDARPARLADAGEVRGHQHLRARLEVRAVGDGPAQPRADRPDDAERHRLGERVRVGRQQRFERVGHRVDPGRGRDGRRQADGQAGSRIVVTGSSDGWPT